MAERRSSAALPTAEVLSLTPAQRGMWFAENLSPDYSVNVAQYLDIRHEPGGFDLELFGECNLAAGRVLQSPYVRLVEQEDGTPAQVVDFDLPITVDILDFRDETDPEAAALDWMRAEYRAPLDIAHDPLVVSRLLRIADDRTFWYGRGHHIVIDGFAALTLVRLTVERYNAARRGAEPVEKPAATLAEIVADEQKYQDSPRRNSDHQHWAELMADLPERVTLSRRPAATGLSPANIVAGSPLPAAVQSRIEELAGELGSSSAMILAAAYGAYLYRMTGNDDVLISLPVTGRATAKIKRAGGMVSNILPVRMTGLAQTSVGDLVRSVQLEMTGALRHQRYRSDDIRRDAGLDADAVGFGPTINMVFFDAPIEIDGARVDYRILASGILEDLLVNLYQAGPGLPLVVDLHGNPFRYTEAEIAAHHRRFLAFVEAFVAHPDAPVWQLPLLLAGEEDSLRDFERGRVRDFETGSAHLLDAFAGRVRASPNDIAVYDGDDRYTYAEFDAIRSALAQILRERGTEPGDRVGIVLERGVTQVAAVYAALSVGAAYVPVGPADPAARRELIVETASPALVVDTEFLETVGFTVAGALASPSPSQPLAGAGLPAYVIFTSGSTGVPKGVQVGTAAVLNRLSWMQEDYPIGPADAVMYKTPITFDVSVWELLWPLRTGAAMVIAKPDGHRDPEYLIDLIARRSVTTMHFVPAMLAVFLEAADGGLPSSLRRIFTSGEDLPATLAARVSDLFDGELVNLYGPTEAAVDITQYRVPARPTEMRIGAPVANSTVLVLDDHLGRLPVGAIGELYLAGYQLADGYAAQAGLTADRFVANPDGRGERMYRTGDLVRWTEDATLQYVGRVDFQVKIRGQRVELGEIESALGSHPDVDSAVAVVRELDAGAAVIGYVRAPSGRPELLDELERECAAVLPAHMVPAAVVVLDEFPTSSSGKLDRRALPEPTVLRGGDVEYVAPASEVEKRIAQRIEQLLGVRRVGLRDNLFSLGADSLAAARLATALRTRDDLTIPLTAIFAGPDVAALAAAAQMSDPDRPPLRAADRPPTIPVSATQTRLWFVNRLDPDSPAYNMPGAVRLGPAVDLPALRQAIADVVIRHESLRTRFVEVDGEPVQVVGPAESVTPESAVTVVDTADVDAAVVSAAAVGFDLSRGAFRAELLRGPESVLVVTLHHIVGDGASLRPLIGDVLTAYNARRHGFAPFFPPLPVQYADYTLWYAEVLGDADAPDSVASREIDYWKRRLAGAPELTTPPADRPRPHRPTGRGGFVDRVLTPAAVAELRELAAATGVTLFTVVEAALAVVLARLSDTDDVVIGTAVAGRDEPELADLVGMFVNTVALRTSITPGLSVRELLTAVQRNRAEALSHSTTPFEHVVDAVAPSRTLEHSPIFQVALTLVADAVGAIDTEHDFEVVASRVPAAKYDLSITAVEKGAGGLELEYNYAADLFDPATVESLAVHVERVLHAMTVAPDTPIGRIDLVDAEQVRRLTAPAAASAQPRTLRAFVGEWLAAGCRRDDQALLVGDAALTATAASSRINQLARELIARGIGPGTTVGVRIPRSVDSVVAMLAVAVAGAAFVFIDPKLPPARQAALLADSGVALGITTAAGAAPDTAAPDAAVHWLVLEDEVTELHLAGHPTMAVADAELTAPVPVDGTAYLIYTSGSTGRPKAVEVTHAGLANLVANQRDVLGLDPGAVVLHMASPAFDAMVFELMMAVGAQARLVVADAETIAGPELEQTIADGGVTHAVMTPTVLATLGPAAVPGLSTVLAAGEACPDELARTWARHRRFFNLYGPSEFTIWATADGPMVPGDPITIGRALPGVRALVLDSGLRPTPVGVVGDLYLSGAQNARGYHDRAGLTAGAFVADPFGCGGRIYRTGDRVVRRADGKLVFHGRSDFQLKIRGLRIEPGEIDAVLATHPTVANVTTVGVDAPSGEQVLAAYVAPRPGEVIAPDELLGFAREHLPGHYVPQLVKVIDEFPRTPIGKIDRAALPAIEFGDAEFVAPRSELEATVAGVFAAVLDIDRISVTSGFFEMGGNSLSAVKLAARLASVVDRPVGVETVFEAPTPAGLAARLAQDRDGRPGPPPLGPRPRANLVPVSAVQRGMWLLNRANPESSAYNLPLTLRLTGELDLDALRRALVDVVDRHESLRTMYPMINGVPVQVIESTEAVAAQIDAPLVDLSGGDAPAAAALAEVTDRGFDVTGQVPIRAAVLRLAPLEHVLTLVVHHISVDGASMSPLARDLMIAYEARRTGEAPQWPPLPVQFADYAIWTDERLGVAHDGESERDRQLGYWSARLQGSPELLGLPADRQRPQAPTFAGGEVECEIPARIVDGLTAIARADNATLFMVAHAALAVMLAKVSGQADVVVGTPYAGRGSEALDGVVGMFVNSVPLRTAVDPGESFADFVGRVRTADLADLAHADVAFEEIVTALGRGRTAGYNPLFQVMFTFQNLTFPTVELSGLRVEPQAVPVTTVQTDLGLTLFPNDPLAGSTDGAMRATWSFARELFDEATVQRFAKWYLGVLEAVVEDPESVVGDISLELPVRAVADVPETAAVPLPQAVSEAAAIDPGHLAAELAGERVSIGELAAGALALADVLPDADGGSALTMALLSALPALAAGGPAALDEVLTQLRHNVDEIGTVDGSSAATSSSMTSQGTSER
ncbi:amino acid adenylation domain-containing protein [Gordonia sp. X0973]|uniref:non-ribosomal peptide synthetase n=1 Tax=Gordonia sp. X0973 TaxID=2742602 RepID=UPI0013E9B74C|nr:non-ribosomal peptide synthetase [Gordonia sp. X0973]QKT08194.1 amino acid adenylation domain-containing protein [Gordonia sp. X0973]